MPDYVADYHIIALVLMLNSIQGIVVCLSVRSHRFVDRDPSKIKRDLKNSVSHLSQQVGIVPNSCFRFEVEHIGQVLNFHSKASSQHKILLKF